MEKSNHNIKHKILFQMFSDFFIVPKKCHIKSEKKSEFILLLIKCLLMIELISDLSLKFFVSVRWIKV